MQSTPQGVPPAGYPGPMQPVQPPKKHFNKLIIPFILVLLLFMGASAFGLWAFSERATYKNDAQKLIDKQVAITKQAVATAKDKEFVEKEKIPTKAYTGPATFGSVEFNYPKTWSAYIDETGKGGTPLDGYLHPNFVPAIDSGTAFALRVQVSEKSYDEELKGLESDVKAGKVTVTPYRAEKVPDVLGSKIEGELNDGQKDIMVIFPLRDKTIKISTEAASFAGDFSNIILKSLKFVP